MSTLILRTLLGLVQVVVRYSQYFLYEAPASFKERELFPGSVIGHVNIFLPIEYGSGDTTAVQRLELRRLPLSESCCLPMLSCWWRRAHTKWDESFSSGPPGPASWPQMEAQAWPPSWLIMTSRHFCTLSQFSGSVVSDSLRPHEMQHARPPCPSPTPGVYPNSCPSSQWCHPAISSSVIPFSSCPQSLPTSESFPVSQLFASGGQSIGVSASTSVLPMNTQDWSPLGSTGWISLQFNHWKESVLI